MRDGRPVAGVCAAPAQRVRAGRDGRLLGEAGQHLLVQRLLVLGVLPLLHLLLSEARLLVTWTYEHSNKYHLPSLFIVWVSKISNVYHDLRLPSR